MGFRAGSKLEETERGPVSRTGPLSSGDGRSFERDMSVCLLLSSYLFLFLLLKKAGYDRLDGIGWDCEADAVCGCV
jgi:hypothetical protein